MKTHFTLALAFCGALVAAPAFAADTMSHNTMAPANTMAPNAMAPANGSMVSAHKPKPKKHVAPANGGMMAPANTMTPAHADNMSGSH